MAQNSIFSGFITIQQVAGKTNEFRGVNIDCIPQRMGLFQGRNKGLPWFSCQKLMQQLLIRPYPLVVQQFAIENGHVDLPIRNGDFP